MKTAMQEMFSQLEIDQPQLFNINTSEGKAFVNSYFKYIEMEKEQMKRASCPYIGGWQDGEFEYWYNETFKKQ